MGLTEVPDVPRDAEHDPESDYRMADGSLVQRFVVDQGDVFVRVTKNDERTNYRLMPEVDVQS